MIDPTAYFAYMAVVFGLFLIPGPAVLLVLARSISGGRQVGVATGLGVAVGDVAHTVMATLGLSAILMTSALAFEIVKYAGVAYLLYLGVVAFLDKSSSLELGSASRISALQAFRQAIFAEFVNPKTALFFLAFLPQFTNPQNGAIIPQLAILGGTFVVMSAIWTSILAIVAGSASRWINSNRHIGKWHGKSHWLDIYIALCARLALQER